MIEPKGGKVFNKKSCWLGIDEAGRGPVLGPMVYAWWYWPIEYEASSPKEFSKYVDSKKTTEKERERIYMNLDDARKNGKLNFKYYPIQPDDMWNDQLGNVRNLNEISHETAFALIQASLDEGNNIEKVYIDTVGPPKTYQFKLEKKFEDYKIEFWVESKADDKYKCVSAASIVAKYHRDYLLSNWKFVEPSLNESKHENSNFGCGYPGDPVTKEWLNKHQDPIFGFPTIVRFSWSTCDNRINREKNDEHDLEPSWFFPNEKDDRYQKYVDELTKQKQMQKSSKRNNTAWLMKDLGLELL